MNNHQKILWTEGMLLAPSHFQQMDNYYEEQGRAWQDAVFPYWWGVLNLEIVPEDMINGVFAIKHCRVVMPDGLQLDIPNKDAAPESVSVKDVFDTTTTTIDVYLSVPTRQGDDINYQINGMEGRQKLRYRSERRQTVDETTGKKKALDFACANLRLLLGEDSLYGYTSIKIAQIIRNGEGQYAVSPVYIPPALNYKVSTWLEYRLREIINKMVGKSDVLTRQRGHGGGRYHFNISEVSMIWLLHTINTALPALIHLQKTPLVHPERLYFQLVTLAGALMVFDDEARPNTLPSYNHEQLYEPFRRVLELIWDLLDRVIPNKCVTIPLILQPDDRYTGEIEDDYLLKEAAFYLAIKADLAGRDLIDDVRLIKLAAPDEIEDYIQFAATGIQLEHVVSPDPAVPINRDFQYFRLHTRGEKWERVCQMKKLRVFVPGSFPNPQLGLYAVKP